MRTTVGHFFYTNGGKDMDSKEPNQLKVPKTYEEQVSILKERGLHIDNEQKAIEVLKRINYYRLTAYGLTLKTSDKANQFKSGISFEHILKLYEFDKELRLLLLDAIESIETAFRAHIAYYHAHTYGADAYKDPTHFKNETYHAKFLTNLERSLKENERELFVKHHHTKYQSNFPIWVAVEVLSFSTLSMMFKNLHNQDKQTISKEHYSMDFKYIESWLYTLTMIRNICAHHGRLYGKTLTIRPQVFANVKKELSNERIFIVFFIISKLLTSNERNVFVDKITYLLDTYAAFIDYKQLGIPQEWERYFE